VPSTMDGTSLFLYDARALVRVSASTKSPGLIIRGFRLPPMRAAPAPPEQLAPATRAGVTDQVAESL
jgi:hypothetical protein